MDETPVRPTTEEIVVIHRAQETAESPVSRLDKLEQGSKILSLILVPMFIAISGWWIQDGLSRRTTSQQYVELAVTLLADQERDVDPGLRDWAVDVLIDYSPVRMSEAVAAGLREGRLALPPSVSSWDTLGRPTTTTCMIFGSAVGVPVEARYRTGGGWSRWEIIGATGSSPGRVFQAGEWAFRARHPETGNYVEIEKELRGTVLCQVSFPF